VSAASAIRWQQLAAEHGRPKPQQQEGDPRSLMIEAHADLTLETYNARCGITLAELQAIITDHGIQVAPGTIGRSFERRGIARKKTAHATEQDRAHYRRHHPRPLNRYGRILYLYSPAECANNIANAGYNAS
jgi:transposase